MNAFTNNYPQNQGYNTGMPNFQPMGYAPQQPSRPQMTNPLTPEQKDILREFGESMGQHPSEKRTSRRHKKK